MKVEIHRRGCRPDEIPLVIEGVRLVTPPVGAGGCYWISTDQGSQWIQADAVYRVVEVP